MNSYRIYRANKNGTGTATDWQLSFKGQDRFSPWKLFLKIVKQVGVDDNGNARFNWDQGITVKLDLSDIGEILAVLDWKQAQVGSTGKLFHQNGNENKVINFNYNQNTNNYFIKISHQSANGVNSCQQTISLAEGKIIQTLLGHAILKLTGWSDARGYSKSSRAQYANKAEPGAYEPQNAVTPIPQAVAVNE